MLAVLQRLFRQLVMRPHRRHHRDSINIGRRTHLCAIGSGFDFGIGLRQPLEHLRALVADNFHLASRGAMEISHNVGTPVTVTNDTHSNHAFRLFGFRRFFPDGLSKALRGGALSKLRRRNTLLSGFATEFSSRAISTSAW